MDLKCLGYKTFENKKKLFLYRGIIYQSSWSNILVVHDDSYLKLNFKYLNTLLILHYKYLNTL